MDKTSCTNHFSLNSVPCSLFPIPRSLLPALLLILASSCAPSIDPSSADEPPESLLPPKDAGGRGETCLIAPKMPPKPVLVWRARPIFIWRGAVDKVAVFSEAGEVMMERSTDISPTDRDLIIWKYDGEALQEGEIYTWKLFEYDTPIYRVDFQLMKTNQQEAIATELTILESQLADREATSEEITLAKIDYFAQQQLWADALGIAFTTEEKYEAVLRYRQAVTTHLCD